jgi:hypothetical protein
LQVSGIARRAHSRFGGDEDANYGTKHGAVALKQTIWQNFFLIMIGIHTLHRIGS